MYIYIWLTRYLLPQAELLDFATRATMAELSRAAVSRTGVKGVTGVNP